MIHGIGTDIVLEKRIAALYKKHGRAFAERVLHPAELPALAAPPQVKIQSFTAKYCHNAKGKPETLFAPPLQAFLDELGIARVHISISDDSGTVTAFAVAEK